MKSFLFYSQTDFPLAFILILELSYSRTSCSCHRTVQTFEVLGCRKWESAAMSLRSVGATRNGGSVAVPVVNLIMQLLWSKNTWRLGKMKTECCNVQHHISRSVWSFLELCVRQHKWAEQCWRLLRLRLHTRLSVAGNGGSLAVQRWAEPPNWVEVLCLCLLTQPWQPGFGLVLPIVHVAATCLTS